MPTFIPKVIHLVSNLCFPFNVLLGKEKKLDSFVLVAVLGFESPAGDIMSSQFIYHSEESKPNYIEGSREQISEYLVQHFCSPSGTVLDASNDIRGKLEQYIWSIISCLFFRNNVTGGIGKWKKCHRTCRQ